jgi:hypothetical protein
MIMHTPKSLRGPLFIAATAAILFSAVAMAIAPGTDWFHSSFNAGGILSEQQLPPAMAAAISLAPVSDTPRKRLGKPRCDDCAVFESIRHVAAVAGAPETYEITVRLRDGSTRVSNDPTPANWLPGDRIIVVGSAKQPGL